MSWKNWKSWVLVAGLVIAAAALYAFTSPDEQLRTDAATSTATTKPRAGVRTPVAGGAVRSRDIDPIRPYRPSATSYSSRRDLFAFVEPPRRPDPVVVPVVVKPEPPPPDSDKDTIPDFRDNCPAVYNPDQTDIDRNGVGAACQQGTEIAPPPPLPPFPYKYIGTFGSAKNQIATFSLNGEVTNVRVGDTFGGQFILRNIGIESVDIGYVGRSEKTRIPIGQ